MKRIFWLGMALTTMLMLPACGSQKHAAETALAQATQAWNAIKAQAANIVPDEAKSIDDGIAELIKGYRMMPRSTFGNV